MTIWRQKNPEKRRAHAREEYKRLRDRIRNDPEFAKQYREKANLRARHWRKRNPEKERLRSKRQVIRDRERYTFEPYFRQKRALYHLKRKYGLTEVQLNQLLEKQKNRCAGCQIEFDSKENMYNIDHCHTTGIIRGLLCTRCNLFLGAIRDSIGTMTRLITYIEDFERVKYNGVKNSG